jgi:steroid 5-alpha reductase family enzyme
MNKLSKGVSLLIVLLAYIAAFFAGLLVYKLVSPPLLAFFLADVAATLVVWLVGLAFRNASLYDPYWSVAPPVLFAAFLLVSGRFGAVSAVYLAVFLFWGVRLTRNWAIGWRGLSHQDWRYTMLHDKNPKLYFLTNLFGINLVPTLFVFAALVPAYLTTLQPAAVTGFTVVGAAVCLGAVALEIVSDAQLRRFRQRSKNAGKSIDVGLWRYSRHPNYFGEVSFWWGVWLIQLSVLPQLWWTVAAPVLMTLLFLCISIPMMEARLLASRPDYADYRRRTSALLPLPLRKQGASAASSDVV